ncbi:hypothetical protein VTP01DRAFT_7342 [Rhizomucor pusillus]|uniref:uncharacterized protein n=1 Tax=Rhizomucor pusillus TaxID=4840 RepID=UPI0037424E07
MFTLDDFEDYAKQHLAPGAFGYYSSGSDAESTLRRNREAFDRVLIRPKILVNVEKVQTATTILGHKLRSPICVAPTAFHGMAHHDGEKASVAATVANGNVFCLSTNSNYGMDAVSAAARKAAKDPFLWFQLYMSRDKELMLKMVRKCESSGYKALVVTTDRPRLGRKLVIMRSGFTLPRHLQRGNFEEDSEEDHFNGEMYPGMTWKDIAWLKTITELPIIIKGIFREEDARMAVQQGVDGIIVSNHGGRQLDSCPASLEVLPEIVRACRGTKVEIYFDGGVRRGTDVFKALAMGAKAVFVGRPVLWGLAYRGESGVKQVLNLLQHEFQLTMALAGCTKIEDIDISFLIPHEDLSFTRSLHKL